ncbi:MAG TPA: bifunctional precorrin-2 dehydrogenase/sirohydrochlorin ferrochelatase [Mucilaginibacter sp.]|jgi:siroheme synthase-like protein|nr:bifunctional precorrin-2 dehydrogenase/sirohydrochlorin ferrochelatase [Mucilaginibacter sp.]
MTSSLKNKESGKPAEEKQRGNPLFPVFLKLNNLHTVLIGAGNVGLEKLNAILGNCSDAKVTIIALTVLPKVYTLAAAYSGVTVKQKAFAASDLDDANIALAATNDAELNDHIVTAAHERRLLVNIADKPDLCDFYLGSIVQKGDLKLAISTNGKSPTVAKRLRQVLDEALPDEIDTTLQQMSQLRASLNGDFTEKVKTLNEVTAVLVSDKGIKEKSGSAR